MFFSYQLLPYMLGMCGSVAEVRLQLENAVIAEGDFSKNMPSTPLHWIFADHKECITVESVKEGLKIYENPIGALTNSPDFAYQLTRISDFLGLSASNLPSSSYNDGFVPYSRGMGAIGLPGDFSSTSRLARASFLLKNTIIRDGSRVAVEDFFHIADSVAIPLGAVRSETDKPVCTLYTCCACSELGAYFYTTYSDRSIRRVKFDSDLTEPFEMEMK
jgi:choloylglycine hydrolase